MGGNTLEPLLVLLAIALVLSPFFCIVLQVQSSRRISALESEVRRLHRERDIADRRTREGQAGAATSAEAPTPSPTPPDARLTPTAPTPRATPEAATAPSGSEARRQGTAAVTSSAARPSLEVFLGGRVMLVIGVVAVLFAVGFFLKIAVDRGWIGPTVRIALGVALGGVLLAAGSRFAHRGVAVFGHALMGAGLGALYLSNFFAAVRYDLVERPLAFVIAGALTALGAVLALRRDTRILAWLGFLGGFLAPALLGENADRLGALTAWLLVLDLGLLGVRLRRRWPGLEIMALTASTAYFVRWHADWFVPERLPTGAWSLAAMVTAVMVVCLAPAIRQRRALAPTALWTTLVAGLVAYGGGHMMMFPEHRHALGAGIVAFGALQAAAGRLLAARSEGRSPDAAALGAFGLAALAVAVPVIFEGRGIAPAWSALGTAAVYAGLRRDLGSLVVGGLLMIGLGAGNVLIFHTPAHDQAFTPFLNGGFLSVITPCAALLLTARLIADSPGRRSTASLPLALAGLWLFTVPLGIELHGAVALRPERFGVATRETALAATAVGIAVYACLLAGLFGSHRGSARDSDGAWRTALPLGPLAAAVVLGLVVLTVQRREGFMPGFNRLFGTELAVTAACFMVGRRLGGAAATTALVSGLALLFVLITREIHAWGEVGGAIDVPREDMRFRAQVAISAAWALYAAALLVTGFRRRRAELRWIGLGLFALTVLKVFLSDMAALDTGYRVGSFLVLGVLLVAASYQYQRIHIGVSDTTNGDPRGPE